MPIEHVAENALRLGADTNSNCCPFPFLPSGLTSVPNWTLVLTGVPRCCQFFPVKRSVSDWGRGERERSRSYQPHRDRFFGSFYSDPRIWQTMASQDDTHGVGCHSACKIGSDSLLMQFEGCLAL